MDKEAKNHSSHSHFLKLISSQVLKNQTLDLPTAFVNENWGSLSKHASLRVPTGEVWKMKLKKDNGGAWLDKGWLSFAENYSIKCFYALFFRYEGGSRFSVLIFDSTTTEIEYPVSARTAPKFTQVKEEEDDITSDKGGSDTFRSPNFSFTVTMQQTYISKPYLCIPESPARRFFRVMGRENIVLKVEDGRSWCMKNNAASNSHHRAYLTAGWDKFSHENHLSKGDRCTFELISNSIPTTFKVTINRFSEEDNALNCVANRTPSTPMEDQPFFKIRMTAYYVSRKCKVHVPSGHARRYLKEDEHGNNVVIFHGSNGKAWTVGYRPSKHLSKERVEMYKGWKVFRSENQLQAGETLVFQMIKGKPKEYSFTIFSM